MKKVATILKISKFLLIFLLITGWIFSGWLQIFNFPPKVQEARATVETFTIEGTFIAGWTAPAGVTSVTAETWGGGGGSGGGTNTGLPGGSGGGGGAYASKVISVTPGNAYNYTVGSAGLKDGGTAGGNSSFTGDIGSSLACGGTSGAVNGGTAGVGGTTACSDGTTEFAGGAGAAGAGTSGGGGGESAGTTATGGSASGTTGGTGTNGTDGSAGQLVGVNGVAGNNPGAGAGGSGRRSGASELGANGGVGQVRLTYTISPTTFLGNDTDPGNATIAPGAATTTVGTFNLKTSSGTDTVTNATTTLSAGSFTGLFGVEITNSANTTIYCSSYNPLSVVVGLTGCNLPVTSASTTFNIRIKPKTHAAMDAPPGATYTVLATTTALTATNSISGDDTTSATITIDNASPNGATATSGLAGDQKVTLNWTTSNSGDFDTTSGSVILRWAAGSAGSEVPAEGKSDYTAGNTISTATVACVIASAASTAQTKIDGSGGSAGCTTTALTNGQQYTYKVFQRDTRGNYDVGVSIGTFTPAGVSLTFTIDTDSVLFVNTVIPGTPVSTSSVLTVNTNNATGYNIKINRASTTPTLILSADNVTTIPDTPNGNNWTAPAATSTAGPSAAWTVGTTLGLGFRLKLTGTVTNIYSSIWWGTDDAGANALYSGISTSTAAQNIANTTLGSASNEKTVVEYKLDTATTQRTGLYVSSPVVFTATVNP